jgi:hypothetical protein
MPSDESEPRLRKERTVPLNVPIPYQLRDRLDSLKALLDDAKPNLYEIVAMLILHAEEDPAKLRELYDRYMGARPETANLAKDSGEVVPFRRRRRGRPPNQ